MTAGYKWISGFEGFRTPTEDEVLALRQAYLDYYGLNPDPETIDNTWWVGIADKYITDGPGYAGKVAIILWAATPSAVTSMVMRGDKWTVQGEMPW